MRGPGTVNASSVVTKMRPSRAAFTSTCFFHSLSVACGRRSESAGDSPISPMSMMTSGDRLITASMEIRGYSGLTVDGNALRPPAIPAIALRYEPWPTATMSLNVPLCRPTMISTRRKGRPATADLMRSSLAFGGFGDAGRQTNLADRRRHGFERSAIDDRGANTQSGELSCGGVGPGMKKHQVGLQSCDQLGIGRQEGADLGERRDLRGKPAVIRYADDAIAETER